MKEKNIPEAVALHYDPEVNRAPEIVAAGKGVIAEKIIEKAEQNNIPIYKDEKTAAILGKMNIGSEIPPELYQVVAEILAFIARLNEQSD